jgi:hypothetical protein
MTGPPLAAALVLLAGPVFAQEQAAVSPVETAALRVLADEHAPFTERERLAEALSDQLSRTADVQSHGRQALVWVRVMRSALGAIPMRAREQEPYRAFLQRHQAEAVYNEPGGQWMLIPDVIWNIHDSNRSSSSAEAIAWEAVENGMPGECEGYPPCELSTLDALDGTYLRHHPHGAHAAEVIARLGQTCIELNRLLDAPNGHELFNPVTDCEDLRPKATALEAALSRSDGAADTIAALKALENKCK